MSGRVLITGGAGFVGSALARALNAESPVIMVRDQPFESPGTIVQGDITDHGFCRRVLADYGIETIYHLAAQSIVSACAEDPLSALDVAVMGTARLLQAVRDAGRPIRVVVSTSDKVYGSSPPPYWEATPLDARHAYEVSKACQDLVARMFWHSYGVDVCVVRAVNIYGPGDPNESRIIPRTIRRVLAGEPPLLHAGAGDMRRQYVYIDDMVNALRTVYAHGVSGEAYCVGSPDDPMSVLQVMMEIAGTVGVPWAAPEVRERDERFHEIAEQWIQDGHLRGLGWSATVPFSEGIRRTVAWYRGENP